jgi:hypothetical protein
MRQEVACPETQILEYYENIHYSGDGGFDRRRVHFANVLPVIQTVHQYTALTCIQEGRVVGYQGWPEGYVPVPYLPTYLRHTEKKFTSPRFTGRQYIGYGIEWRYEFLLPNFYQIYGATPEFGFAPYGYNPVTNPWG